MEAKETVMTDGKQFDGSGWQLLCADSRVILPSRWKIFWQYVVRGERPRFTIQAWVTADKKVGNLLIYVNQVEGEIK